LWNLYCHVFKIVVHIGFVKNMDDVEHNQEEEHITTY
jgi:hypothetical protein